MLVYIARGRKEHTAVILSFRQEKVCKEPPGTKGAQPAAEKATKVSGRSQKNRGKANRCFFRAPQQETFRMVFGLSRRPKRTRIEIGGKRGILPASLFGISQKGVLKMHNPPPDGGGLAFYTLAEHTEQEACRDGRADDTGHVGAHSMHQQEVGGVGLLAFLIGYTGSHRHGGNTGRADKGIDLALG